MAGHVPKSPSERLFVGCASASHDTTYAEIDA
ncbi:hypothetical protein SNOG_15446 [Parastagonospora nodorum SN15]|uniref:Uncharacterized protein n=1 Tax=Phaeosphaeria nodorum (strain SN15 / ATCC MYA-4574 / FGSC 10173) TaxID=321614 RepID=Q0TYA4_PHANO|nr:hypothetical protein SNOG_15446 [Parastagonospora nodorum SN15]EAT77111.1 hypothetical protein SNOG_15446 [Parastagonospora nodorum SN15]